MKSSSRRAPVDVAPPAHTPETTAAPRRGRQAADVADSTRHAIVDAALALFAERGYPGVSVRDIAERAGTTHGLLRHHFGSKDGVWRAVLDEADARFRAALPDDLGTIIDIVVHGELHDAVREVVRALVLASHQYPQITRLLVHEGAEGGERLRLVLSRVRPLRQLSDPLLERLHAGGGLLSHDRDEFFLLLVVSTALPFALAPLAEAVLGADTASPQHADAHAERVAALLMGQ